MTSPINFPTTTRIEPSSVLTLPNEFKFCNNGLSATKSLSVEVDGKLQDIEFIVHFPARATDTDKVKFLKNLNPNMMNSISKQSISLGLGSKFESMNMFYNNKGIKKLDFIRFDQSIKSYDMGYFNKKEIEVKRLNDPEKTKKFDKKLRMFKSINNTIKVLDQINNPSEKKQLLAKKSELEKKLDDMEKNSILKDYYIGDKRALDILKDYLRTQKSPNLETINKWAEENIFTHPDLHKKT